MGRKRKGRASKKAQRRAAALGAQDHLANILVEPRKHPTIVVDAAAVHLIKTSQRHRLPLPVHVKDRVCRRCWAPLTSSSSFRVRIKHGQRIKTCLKCGSLRRFGGGPKHHRRQQEG